MSHGTTISVIIEDSEFRSTITVLLRSTGVSIGIIDERHAGSTGPISPSSTSVTARWRRSRPSSASEAHGLRPRSSLSPPRRSPIRFSGPCAPAPTSIAPSRARRLAGRQLQDRAETHDQSSTSLERRRAIDGDALVFRCQRRRRHHDDRRQHRNRNRQAVEAPTVTSTCTRSSAKWRCFSACARVSRSSTRSTTCTASIRSS